MNILMRRVATVIVSLLGACCFILTVYGLALLIPAEWVTWKASKTFTVLGSFAVASGALLQAWKDSSNGPKNQYVHDRWSLFSWALVCSGAISVLVGSILTRS